MEKLDFFISYTAADRKWAEWIAWQLEDAGYACRIQVWDFLPGSNFVQEMEQGVKAQRTLLVVSPEYWKSDFARAEWQAAFAQDPIGEKRKVLPVKVQECDIEGLLDQVVWIDLTGLGELEAKHALLNGARGERLKPMIVPPFPGAVQQSFQQPPSFPGTTSAKASSPIVPQASLLDSDPTLIPAAYERVKNAFKRRPPQLSSRVWMQVVCTPIHNEEIFDPNQFIDQFFIRKVIQLARQGEPSLFDDMAAISHEVSPSSLTIIQQQGKRLDESLIRLVLYSDGTVSTAFTGLHRSTETHSSFSHFIIDEDLAGIRLHQALNFVARCYDYQDPHLLKCNSLVYSIGFYDLQFHRFAKTPSRQMSSFAVPTQSRFNPLYVYGTPRKVTRSELQSSHNLVNHAITRTKLVFDNAD